MWMSAQARPQLAVEAIEIRYNFFQAQELSNYLKFTAPGAGVHCSGTRKCLKYMQTGLKTPRKFVMETRKCRNYSSESLHRELGSFGKRLESSKASSQKLKRKRFDGWQKGFRRRLTRII